MVFWIICAIILALFIFFFIFGYTCFCTANRRRTRYPADRHEHGGGDGIPEDADRRLKESRVWFDAAPWESVSVSSHDGLRLCGQLLAAEGDDKGVIVCFHGYHSSCRRDLSIQTQILHEAGYHLLLVSQRSHGESEGKYICFGAKERYDVNTWCCFVTQRFGGLPIGLLGLSMGAASVLMSISTDLPPTVRALLADCGFFSPWEIIWHTLRRKHKIPPFPVIYFMNYWSRMLADFDYRSVNTADCVKESKLPILLIHGEKDVYVPCEMSRRLHAACPEQTELITVKDAPHSQSIFYAPSIYQDAMLDFFKKHL